ncbi:hypothetical protein [Photorhabdus caribbeanensis]|uniref:hypothetical protein n=1 Tax=Photorhabdus caribbeanensis TaxID=1004165 RepID=UPI001BD5DE8B|nr:hypothetical protein [Photorhabdus caribbeanensis]MBS9423269.1 hypothetical protein [Photorhabdus caribbeanensis]
MNKEHKAFIKKNNVISTILDEDEIVVLDKDSDVYIGLVGAAKDVWSCKSEIISFPDVIKELKIDDDIDIENIKEAFHLLEKEGLILEYVI